MQFKFNKGCGQNHPEARPCKRCGGTGYKGRSIRRQHCGAAGLCFDCNGSGFVGGVLVELDQTRKALALLESEGAQRKAAYADAAARMVMRSLGVPVRGYSDARMVELAYKSLCAARRDWVELRKHEVELQQKIA